MSDNLGPDVAIVVTDRKGDITWMNEMAEALTGYSADELLFSSVTRLESYQHGTTTLQRFWKSIVNGNTWTGQAEFQHKEGFGFLVAVAVSPRLDDTHKVSHFRFAIVRIDDD